MAKNLNYDANGSMCYGNDSADGDKYGILYNCSQAKNIYPAGWRLPNDTE